MLRELGARAMERFRGVSVIIPRLFHAAVLHWLV